MAEIPVGQMERRESTPKKDRHLISRRNFIKLVGGAGAVMAGKVLIDHGFNVGSVLEDAKNRANEEISKRVVDINIRTGQYDMPVPPGREAEDLSKIPSQVSLADIPTIPESDETIPKNAVLGFSGILNEGEDLIRGPQGDLKTVRSLPEANITGYLIAKERQPDGSILFAIELPYLSGTKDVLARNNQSSVPEKRVEQTGPIYPPGLSKEQIANLKKQDLITVGGAIVWIRLYDSKNPTYEPFDSLVTWGQQSFFGSGISGPTPQGSGEKTLAKYSRTSDPISVHVKLGIDVNSDYINGSLKNFVSLYHYGNNTEQLKTKLQQDANGNLESVQRLIEDTGKAIPIEEQFSQKRYIFLANKASFLPK